MRVRKPILNHKQAKTGAREKNAAAMIQERQCVKGKSDKKNIDTDRR